MIYYLHFYSIQKRPNHLDHIFPVFIVHALMEEKVKHANVSFDCSLERRRKWSNAMNSRECFQLELFRNRNRPTEKILQFYSIQKSISKESYPFTKPYLTIWRVFNDCRKWQSCNTSLVLDNQYQWLILFFTFIKISFFIFYQTFSTIWTVIC